MASGVDRARSVSSIRSRNLPPRPRANSQLKSAVRAPPMWSAPVGEGADGRTFAEMTPEEKHGVSHRGRAFRRLADLLARE